MTISRANRGKGGDHAIDLEITLRADLAKKLETAASKLARAPVALLADVLERVIEDDLFAAVLDDDA